MNILVIGAFQQINSDRLTILQGIRVRKFELHLAPPWLMDSYKYNIEYIIRHKTARVNYKKDGSKQKIPDSGASNYPLVLEGAKGISPYSDTGQ